MQCDLSVSEFFQAYYDCRKTKRNTWNALIFEEHLERNLMDLYYELISGEYQPGRSIMFVVTKPKPREIWASDFRDRIVHHVLYNRYSCHFYKRFIHDSYACIPEKGTLRAANRVQHFIRSVTKNHTQEAWFLKADIANFFVSINKTILERLLAKHITDHWWMDLTNKILYNDPKENAFIKSPKSLLNKVPKHKSLLNAQHNFGLPIGNLSSQFFANIYLNELDQYAKHTLHLRYYIRYVDDIVVLGLNGSELNTVYDKLSEFCSTALGVSFHPRKKEVNKVNLGINFVGYVIKPWCKYIRRSTINNMRSSIDNTVLDVGPSINSYLGMLRNANSYKERQLIAHKLNTVGYSLDSNLTKVIQS